MEITTKDYNQMMKIIYAANQANGAMRTAISLMDWKGKEGFQLVQQELNEELKIWKEIPNVR